MTFRSSSTPERAVLAAAGLVPAQGSVNARQPEVRQPASRGGECPMSTSTGEAVTYLRWKKDVDTHDYAAASSYLSIRFGESRAEEVAAELQKQPVITRRANDILRATGRAPLPLSDPGVLKDLKKVLAGEKLSPILVAEADVADGYHRVSLAYAL